jgi:predicted amidophosphoribosyltransferase
MGLLTSKIKCGNTSFTHFYLCPYLPLTAGMDTLSFSLLRFKQRIQPDLDAWIDCSRQLLGRLPFSSDTIILRALRHDEITARTDFPSALDLLGHSLAIDLRCRYLPGLLSKSRTTLPNKHLTRRQRRTQLLDVYHLSTSPVHLRAPEPPAEAPETSAKAGLTPTTPFLLIDDILTTGATMRALIRTLRHHYPACPIKTFTLTRADYHCPAQPLAARGEICSIETLKSQIFANTV